MKRRSDSGAPDNRPDGEARRAPIGRRDALRILGVAGVSAVGLTGARAASVAPDDPEADPYGLLIDTTRCGGCQTCEVVCAETNDMPEPDLDAKLGPDRPTSETQWTAVSAYDTDAGEIYVKKQCMHCLVPACSSACLTKAMAKTPEGPVTWNAAKCMGCRFCMISCPFDVPKFEYNSPTPRIQKCRLCRERLLEGKLPACVENCPAEALQFGRRSELLTEARRRIHDHPGDYHPEIYGEHEVGGTSVLYLAAVPFEQLGFKTNLGTTPQPALTEDFLYGVPVVLTVLPALLAGIGRATRREDGDATEEGEHHG